MHAPCNTALLQSGSMGALKSGRRRSLLQSVDIQPFNNNSNNDNTTSMTINETPVVTEDDAAAIEAWFANGTGTPPPEACYGGTFKPYAGNGPCVYCPSGASTTGPNYVGATNAGQCVCLPGYFAVRESGSGAMKKCIPCPSGTYRSSLQIDTVCVSCPQHMYTLGPGSAYCYCMPGFYPNMTYDACVPCDAGFYCDGNVRIACPPHAISPVGSTSQVSFIYDLYSKSFITLLALSKFSPLVTYY